MDELLVSRAGGQTVSLLTEVFQVRKLAVRHALNRIYQTIPVGVEWHHGKTPTFYPHIWRGPYDILLLNIFTKESISGKMANARTTWVL